MRAGIVEEPAEYRWSSYGEAIGGGSKGHGKTARAGLVRAWGAHKGLPADARLWSKDIAQAYRIMLMGEAVELSEERVTPEGQIVKKVLRKGINKDKAVKLRAVATGQIPFATVLRCRVRYFTDGAVIGSRAFVDEAFVCSRTRFGSQRKSGARKLKGGASAMGGTIWSLRDLKKA